MWAALKCYSILLFFLVNTINYSDGKVLLPLTLINSNQIPSKTKSSYMNYKSLKDSNVNEIYKLFVVIQPNNTKNENLNIEDRIRRGINSWDNFFITSDLNYKSRNLNDGKRTKRSIPVLEPVKHLLNTVGNGRYNHTTHSKKHHQLVNANENSSSTHHINNSSAIETEEEREMVNESNSLKLFELLGSFGSLMWEFLTNIQKFFAASSESSSSLSSGAGR